MFAAENIIRSPPPPRTCLCLLRLSSMILLYNLSSCKNVMHQLRMLQMDYFIIRATSPALAITISMAKTTSIFFHFYKCNANTTHNQMICSPTFQFFIDNKTVAGFADICHRLGPNTHAINSSTHIHAAEKMTDYESNFLK